MSWDVYLMKIPENISSVVEMGNDFESQPLGNHEDILKVFKELFPTSDFTDPNWGMLDTEDYAVEFNISKSDPVDSIMLHIRGNDKSVEIVEGICKRTGWRAIDTGSGDFIDFSNSPENSFKEWSRFRNQVLGSLEKEPIDEDVPKKDKDNKRWWMFWR